MTGIARRRLLLALVLATMAVVVLDLAGSTLPDRAKAFAATAIGPVQRAVAAVDRGDTATLAEQNAELRMQLAQAQARLAQDAAAGRLLQSPSAAGGHLLSARVVGSSTTVTGGRQVTLDVGGHDGVEPNLTVVSADGLVGRVVAVGPWSSDVRLLGGTDATVAVRVGVGGSLGTIGSTTPPGAPERPRNALTLALVDQSSVTVGDQVTTLGSVGGRPYGPGIVVGTVTSLDPPRGGITGTAVVRPAVEAARLDVVAVVLTPASPTTTSLPPAASAASSPATGTLP